MECQKVKRKLLAFLDNELNQREKTEIEEHLNSCPGCAEEMNLLSRISVAFSRYGEIEPPSNFRNVVRQKIEKQEKGRITFLDLFRLMIKNPLPKIAALLLIIWLLVITTIVRKSSAATKVLINVEGITGICCIDPLETNLRKITGVKDVSIDLNSQIICITLRKGRPVRLRELEKAINDAGPYLCKDIKIVSASMKKR